MKVGFRKRKDTTTTSPSLRYLECVLKISKNKDMCFPNILKVKVLFRYQIIAR